MRSASVTINRKINLLIVLLSCISIATVAQENSPYSRYGLGDLVPSQSIISRGMGGISAGFIDYDKRYDLKEIYPRPQTVNFLNPASYSKLRITSFDLGFEVDSRTLQSPASPQKFNAASAIVSYLQLGIPLSRKNNIGMNIGLRPVTRINYKIEKNERVSAIDSVQSLFTGTGGSYEVFVGLGKAFKNFSIGFNTGYYFGTKNYSTRKSFIPDSLEVTYYQSNHETKTTFGGLLFNVGAQYAAQLNKKTSLQLGAYGNFKRKYNAKKNILAETFQYDASGGTFRIDSVSEQKDIKGTLEYPSSVGFGFTITREDKWIIGADFSTTAWSDYRFFGEKDATQNEWLLKVGGQLTPNQFSAKNYFSRVTYRLGFFTGPDYIKVNNKSLPRFGVTAGVGLPVRKNPYTNQYTQINLALEYGKRGNNSNVLRENLFRVALGLTLSDRWFVKRKYD